MAQEAGRLIERHGGVAIMAPSMREVPLAENSAAFEFARRLLAGELDVVIFMTGVGAKALFEVLAGQYPQTSVVAALREVTTVVRGPKPARVLRAAGVEPTLEIPEPNTWREVLAELARHSELAGKRIAVQEYGVSNRDLIAGLEARGAEVVLVPIYRWALPEDREPLHRALAAIASGAGRSGPVYQRHAGQSRAPGCRGARMRARHAPGAWRHGRGVDWSGLLRRVARAWPVGRS